MTAEQAHIRLMDLKHKAIQHRKAMRATIRRANDSDPSLPAFALASLPGMERTYEELQEQIAALEPLAAEYRYEARRSDAISFRPLTWYQSGSSPEPFDPGPIPECLRRTQ